MQIYVVKQGDTVDTIAGEYGVSVEDIIYDNQIPSPVIRKSSAMPTARR